jgi:RimJ/RimL family protein N-acetyltransferase
LESPSGANHGIVSGYGKTTLKDKKIKMKTEFKLRHWTNDDLNSLVSYANNWNIAKNLTDRFPFPYSENDGQTFIESAIKDDPIRIFAIDIKGQAVGGIGIYPQDDIYKKNGELGYWAGENEYDRYLLGFKPRVSFGTFLRAVATYSKRKQKLIKKENQTS